MMLPKKIQTNLIIAIVILIVVFVAYKFLGKIKNDIVSSKEKRKNKKDLKDLLDSHVQDDGGQVINNVATFKDAEYKLMADGLYESMEGIGTDEATIFAVLSSLRTKADWLALVSAYGTKKAKWGSFKGSLVTWLTDELGGSHKTKVNNLLGKFNVQI